MSAFVSQLGSLLYSGQLLQNFAPLWGATTTTKRVYNCMSFHALNTEALSLIINRVKFR
jgi:putative component of membrane protein insertase Oxa1/YidC/SpoIIIJ protein YidD